MGIPQPQQLDPLCGAAALAACLRGLGLSSDRRSVLKVCKVTGRGSTMADLLTACEKMPGVTGRVVQADEHAIQHMPLPAVAFVQRDHFVSLIRADKKGVTYLCSDCGDWPGGRVDLSWEQWRAMQPGIYLTVVKTDSEADRVLHLLCEGKAANDARVKDAETLAPIPGVQVAFNPFSRGKHKQQLGSVTQLSNLYRELEGHLLMTVSSGVLQCGYSISAQQCLECLVCCANFVAGGGMLQADTYLRTKWFGGGHSDFIGYYDTLTTTQIGPTHGDPVNLANLQEEYVPAPDLIVYNPNGPGVLWSRMYQSLRGYNEAYQSDDFGQGWTHGYNIAVMDTSVAKPSGSSTCVPNTGSVHPKYVLFPSGARASFTLPSIPNASTPTVACSVQANVPLIVNALYDSATGSVVYQVIFADQTVWNTVPMAQGTTVGHFSTPVIIGGGGDDDDIADGGNGTSGAHTNGTSGTATYILYLPIMSIADRVGNAINLVYNSALGPNSYLPTLSSIQDASTNTALLTISRNGSTGAITHVDDCYGRSVYYQATYQSASGVPQGFSQGYYELTQVSQIVATGTANPPMRYQHGYSLVHNGEGSEQVPFLTSTTVPSPTGVGTSTATLAYEDYTGYLKSVTDANGNVTTFTVCDGSGAAVSGQSNYASSLYTKVTIADSLGNVAYSKIVGFDSNMSHKSETDGNGVKTQIKSFGNPANPYKPDTITDGNGRTWNYTWDSHGNMLTCTDPRSTVTTLTWDYSHFALGRVMQAQQGNKAASSVTYFEPSGLTESISIPKAGGGGLATYSCTYTNLGNLLTMTGPGNNATSLSMTTFNYTADGTYSQNEMLGCPIKLTDNAGNAIHLRYSAQGFPTSGLDADGNAYQNTYNIANQSLINSAPATGQTGSGNSHTIASYLYPGGPLSGVSLYDESGNLSRQISYGYGHEGESLQVTGNTESVAYLYDALYRIATLVDANSHQTDYSYNVAGYLSQISYPGGDTLQYPSYNSSGQLLQRIDGRGIVTNYTYGDIAGAMNAISYPASPSLNVSGTYDNYGRLSTKTDAMGTRGYAYDDQNNLTSVVTTYTGLSAKTIGYTYYADGSQAGMSTPAGSFTYAYDNIGRLTGLTNPFNESVGWTFANNSGAGSNVLTTSMAFNPQGQLSSLTNVLGSTGLSAFGAMSYDAAGNRTGLTATLPSATGLSGSTTYGYDNQSRLTSEASTRGVGLSHTFGFDAAGNPTTFQGSSRSYNSKNQLTATGFTYDSDGNPTSYNGTTLAFDANDKLTTVGTAVTAGYLCEGLRAWKQNTATGARTYFLYDDDVPVVEMDASGNVTAVNTFGAMGLISRHVTGVGSTTYTFDERGNVAQRLDASGSVISSDLYSAFGTLQSGSGNGSDPFGFGAQYGYYTDAETGLVLCQQRYYDPGTGRWVNRDPIGYEGGNNLYRYCGNNPVMYADPSGLWPHLSTDACYALGVFGQFLLGIGPTERNYGPTSLQSRQMKNSDSNWWVRYWIWHHRAEIHRAGAKGAGDSVGTLRALNAAGIDHFKNWTQNQVGGFGFTVWENGNGYIIRIDNNVDLDSFLYHIPGIPSKLTGGNWGGWERGQNGFGPLGQIHQHFYYSL